MSCSRRITSFWPDPSSSSSLTSMKLLSRFSDEGYDTRRDGRSARRLMALRMDGKMASVLNR